MVTATVLGQFSCRTMLYLRRVKTSSAHGAKQPHGASVTHAGVADGYVATNVRRPDTVGCLQPVGGTQWGDRPSWLRIRSKSVAPSCVATAGPNGAPSIVRYSPSGTASTNGSTAATTAAGSSKGASMARATSQPCTT